MKKLLLVLIAFTLAQPANVFATEINISENFAQTVNETVGEEVYNLDLASEGVFDDQIAVSEKLHMNLVNSGSLEVDIQAGNTELSFEVLNPVEVVSESSELVNFQDGSINLGLDWQSTGFRVIQISETDDSLNQPVFSFNSDSELKIEKSGDGSLTVESNGRVIAVVQTPWAVDANGVSLKTEFIVKESTFTQNIETSNSTQFPVVSDPAIIPIDPALDQKVFGNLSNLPCSTWIFYGLRGSGESNLVYKGLGLRVASLVSEFDSRITTSNTVSAIALRESDNYEALAIPIPFFTKNIGITNLPSAVSRYMNSANSSIGDAKLKLLAIRDKCPNSRLIPVGYSQGAWILGKALSGLSKRWWTGDETLRPITASVLLADPGREPSVDVPALTLMQPGNEQNISLSNGIAVALRWVGLKITDKREWSYPNQTIGKVLSVCDSSDLFCNANTISAIQFAFDLDTHEGNSYGGNGDMPNDVVSWVWNKRAN